MENLQKYFLGLDIGTNSVGYAATGKDYDLLKFRGEPVWGVTTFEEASLAEERRINRASRRRLDRCQQRISMLQEIFAPYICQTDPNFFVRRAESALFAEDSQQGVRIFDGGIDDKEYHRKYPTIHHLIVELMAADPQSKVQDDSILNNKVLCLSTANGEKGDLFPIRLEIQKKMQPFWSYLKNAGLMNEEKYSRLTRTFHFTADELHQFINRQLVETRQSTKIVTQLLQERYPETEIVYVKACLVSRFRQEFGMLKCRSVNDLHHAKDAYLNIVVGNVYHEKFTRINIEESYSLNLKPLFENSNLTGWKGKGSLAEVRKVIGKNAVHVTRYAFCRKGGLFDQQPKKAQEGLVPLKKSLPHDLKRELPTEKYGGYNKPTASFYLLSAYSVGNKKDIMFVPVELRYAARVLSDTEFSIWYTFREISKINGNKPVSDVRILLNGRPLKINTVLLLDGMPVTIRGKTNKGAQIIVASQLPLILPYQAEQYIKRLESFSTKKKANDKLRLNEKYDHISREQNVELYTLLSQKLKHSIFAKCPGSIARTVEDGYKKFSQLDSEDQIGCLMGIVSWFGSQSNGIDLTLIGGKAATGTKLINAKFSNLAKNIRDLRIVDTSASGLYVSRSENLLGLL